MNYQQIWNCLISKILLQILLQTNQSSQVLVKQCKTKSIINWTNLLNIIQILLLRVQWVHWNNRHKFQQKCQQLRIRLLNSWFSSHHPHLKIWSLMEISKRTNVHSLHAWLTKWFMALLYHNGLLNHSFKSVKSTNTILH